MKKLLIGLLLFIGLAILPATAWEPNDLTKYPSVMKDNNWMINFGLGLPLIEDLYNDDDRTYIWPFSLNVDRNLPIGKDKLPFFLGGHIGYSGEGHLDYWFVNKLMISARFGYHFNWGVENLDTYAVATAGWIFHIGNDEYNNGYTIDNKKYENGYHEARENGMIHLGLKLGIRWFVYEFFGFWAEVGYTTSSLFDAGITFKF